MYKAMKITSAARLCVLALLVYIASAADLPTDRCGTMRDNKTVYKEFFDPNNGHDLLDVQLHILPGTYKWSDIVADKDKWDEFTPVCQCELTIAGVSEKIACMVERRGDWAMDSDLPSIKVNFTNPAILYKGMDRLLLNKHPHDDTRVRNKLSYELLQQIPELPSVFTQFVRLTVDGQNYGLYTLLEDIRKEYLKVHDLKKSSVMYKANNVFWDLNVDKGVIPTTDPTYSEFMFEKKWDVRGQDNHTILIKTYKDVFNANLDNYKVLTEDFNVRNMAAWMAFQYLTAEADMIQNNYAIYAPAESKDCQFPTPMYWMAWDNDGAWFDGEMIGMSPGNLVPFYNQGPQYFWQMRPLRRFLMVDEFVGLMEAQITSQVSLPGAPLSQSNIKSITDQFKRTIKNILLEAPDSTNMCCDEPANINPSNWQEAMDNLATIPTKQKNKWDSWLPVPMPFKMDVTATGKGEQVVESGGLGDKKVWVKTVGADQSTLHFYWEKSFIMRNQPVHYTFILGKSYGKDADNEDSVTDVVVSKDNLVDTFVSISTSTLEPNTRYYWRVVARNTNNNPKYYRMPSYSALFWDAEDPVGFFGVAAFKTSATIASNVPAGQNVPITNKREVVDYNGGAYNFATLDNIDPSAAYVACDSVARLIPEGWSIAQNNDQVRRLIAKAGLSWGGSTLILADGMRVEAATGLAIDGFGELYQNNLGVTATTGDKYAFTAACNNTANFRVLLVDNTTYVAPQPTLAPTNPPNNGTPAPGVTTTTSTKAAPVFTTKVPPTSGNPIDNTSGGNSGDNNVENASSRLSVGLVMVVMMLASFLLANF